MKQNQALTILKTGVNVFLTGEPGSGKSYTINRFVKYLNDHDIPVAITASTGIAATHINGMTIHSWSGIGINKFLTSDDFHRLAKNEKLCQRITKTKVLIIDEISMLSAETLSLADQVCRKIRKNEDPFGGMQVVLVGDFFQLPPVSQGSEPHFAYQSESWTALNLSVCYLTEQHRQEDQQFLSLLSAMRKNNLEEIHYDLLEARHRPFMVKENNLTKLFSHNLDVDRINDQKLSSLPGKTYTYTMESFGRRSLIPALVKGCLSPEELHLKKDAVVMFTKNNSREGYINGTIGKVVGFDTDTNYPIVETKSGEKIEVSPVSWGIEENGIDIAGIIQIPLRLAWAITIHKSQGMSLDAAVIDLRQVFEFGQGYVALSRVRSLSGIHLLGYNENSLLVHPDILKKDHEFRSLSGKAYLELNEVSDKELEEKFVEFIIRSGGSLERVEKSSTKISTYEHTLELIKKGKSLHEISDERNLAEGTIISHLEKLFATEKIDINVVKSYMTEKILKALPKIKKAFESDDSGKLTPIFKALKEKYTFNELKLAKICFLAENSLKN